MSALRATLCCRVPLRDISALHVSCFDLPLGSQFGNGYYRQLEDVYPLTRERSLKKSAIDVMGELYPCGYTNRGGGIGNIFVRSVGALETTLRQSA